MIDCPRLSILANGGVRCACVPTVPFVPLSMPGSPCHQCRPSQRVTPDPTNRETWPLSLRLIAETMSREPLPVRPSPPATPMPTVRQHPDYCHHALKVLDHTGCCGSRRWQCEIKGTVRLADCRRCGEFEPHAG